MYSAFKPCCGRDPNVPWYDGLPKLVNPLTKEDQTEGTIQLCEDEVKAKHLEAYFNEKAVFNQLCREFYMLVAYLWRDRKYEVEIENLDVLEASNPVLM